MRVEKIRIEEFRSIKSIELNIPKAAPLVLFGPNNAGKSNILVAVNRLLGEKSPLYVEMQDNDYFMRDERRHPTSAIVGQFDGVIHRTRDSETKTLGIEYWSPQCPGDKTRFIDWNGCPLSYVSADERAKCRSYLIGAERNIATELSYGSRYSLLSQFTHRIHEKLAGDKKEELGEAFEQIKGIFESLPQYNDFVKAVHETVENSVKGFSHNLDVDFSAYDPSNYANALRIVPYENGDPRSFDEFGTGEQQILLMAFAKAYLQVFGKKQGLVLIIEEPEAHLHPLAQRWLKRYIYDICKDGVQVIVSTHSADFLDPRNIEGLVRVYKEDGETKARQLTVHELVDFCIKTGVPESKIATTTVADFYAAKVTPSQLRGMFADKVLLVEGATEALALPVYFEKQGYFLAAEGLEIIECHSKNTIPLLWRLYEAYGYDCFCLFDGDNKQKDYDKHLKCLFGPKQLDFDEGTFHCEDKFAYFGVNWEKYFSAAVNNYDETVSILQQDMNIATSGKQALAYAYAVNANAAPTFVSELIAALHAPKHD